MLTSRVFGRLGQSATDLFYRHPSDRRRTIRAVLDHVPTCLLFARPLYAVRTRRPWRIFWLSSVPRSTPRQLTPTRDGTAIFRNNKYFSVSACVVQFRVSSHVFIRPPDICTQCRQHTIAACLYNATCCFHRRSGTTITPPTVFTIYFHITGSGRTHVFICYFFVVCQFYATYLSFLVPYILYYLFDFNRSYVIVSHLILTLVHKLFTCRTRNKRFHTIFFVPKYCCIFLYD